MHSYDKNSKDYKFCVHTFVDNLLEKGNGIPCDKTNDNFEKEKYALPNYYDAEKVKRAQLFFHKHIYAMYFAKVLGLVTILSVPDLAHVLKYTQMSSEPLTAYRRYLITIFHMYIWYNHDFSPESKLWKSIEKVQFKHNSASRGCCSTTKVFISQKNMALTQFGFMGFAILRTKTIGIYDAKKEDLEAFVHIWRVIGQLLGIEERFNICRENLDETREICRELATRVFKPEIQKKHEDFLKLSYALLTGMWCTHPFLEYKIFMRLADKLTTPTNTNNNNNLDIKSEITDFHLSVFQEYYARFILFVLSWLRFTTFRVFQQYMMYLSMWLLENFPFLAYYMFGKQHSHVRAL